MSCNLHYKGTKLIEVVNDQGQPSQLYKEAVSTFGEDKALDIYLTSKSENFTEIYGTEEPDLKTVMSYITQENQSIEPLNREQKIDLQNFALGVENFNVQDLVDSFYDEFGIFTVDSAKLNASKLYSDYEIRNLQNDAELQEKVKQSIEALKNTENVEFQQEIPQQIEKTGVVNSFGKLTNLNPFIVEKDITEKLGGTTQEEFNQIIEDLDYPKFQDSVNKEELFQQMQEYKKAEVFIEVEGEIRQKNNTETELTIPLTTKVVTNQTVKNNINSLINIRLDVLSDNYEQTKEVIKSIEDDLIKEGLDIVGLSEKSVDPDLIEFLQELNLFVNNPSEENTKIYADASDKYFDRDLNPTETVVKAEQDLEYVSLNTNLSEEELYVKNGLIKVKDGLYVKSAKESLDKLYTNLGTYTEKYPKDKTIQEYVQEQITTMNDFNNAENAEAVYLYKMYFNIKNNENGIKRVSQTEKQRGNRGGEIATEASNFLRAEGRTNEKNSSDRQKSELENFAKSNGYWVDNYKKIGEYIGKGMESEVFLSKNGNTVFKINNLEFYDTPLDYLNTINEHNNLFPEAPYKLLGFTKREDTGNLSFVLEQPFVEAERGATQEEVNTELEKLGFDKSISELIFTKGNIEVLDLHEGNVVVDKNGVVYFIDPVIFVTEEQQEEETSIKNIFPTKKTQNFNGNVDYLTGEFISDFWAKALKAKQLDNAEWRNYYSNFGVNERGLYLINDDVITMSKIEEYADENIRQYSLLSKQMPDLTTEKESVQTRQSLRNDAVNNPNNVENFEGQIFKLNDNEIILKDSVGEFVKIGGEVFENVATQGNLKQYVKLEANKSEYNSIEVAEPIVTLNITDYNYLEATPEKFATVKKYLSNENLEEFNC